MVVLHLLEQRSHLLADDCDGRLMAGEGRLLTGEGRLLAGKERLLADKRRSTASSTRSQRRRRFQRVQLVICEQLCIIINVILFYRALDIHFGCNFGRI